MIESPITTEKMAITWAVMAHNVGAVMLARAMHSRAFQKELVDAVRRAGKELLSLSAASTSH